MLDEVAAGLRLLEGPLDHRGGAPRSAQVRIGWVEKNPRVNLSGRRIFGTAPG
ncbi:hypothetical protein [Rhodococcus tibetensis]|uniref:Uncharacterized protein n=1 Tax=Rhodococcus tibetensis TaxID=2965064 RepID=A0ABT1QKC2_9NOCA|nr:hypothetical protein [Rhodococcus sp. FXJ9.536]MCQ4122731.1 hypothetical protein [Rhodococcus sp. FXJ9.536]